MKLTQVAYGAATFFPGFNLVRLLGTGGTDSARYCYSVWARHLVMAHANGLDPNPRVVAELGPGDSLGVGLAALICGCDKYLAFDVIEHANTKRNLWVFDELVRLLKSRADIPGDDPFPAIKPRLDSYRFPKHILHERRMIPALDDTRLNRIRNAILDARGARSPIEYRASWSDPNEIESQSVDMICSQAVLEHVNDLESTYRAMGAWVKPGGYVSHQIDFRCHELAHQWNGHWACSDLKWKVIRGKRPYLLNREPHSTHTTLLSRENFDIVCDQTVTTASAISRRDLAPGFRSLTNRDLVTSGAFIQAVKRENRHG